MNVWLLGAVIVLLGGMVPSGWIAARGSAVDRLVGLQMASVAAALDLLLFSQAVRESQYLIVPLVLVPLSFAGTLVYTRLLAPRP